MSFLFKSVSVEVNILVNYNRCSLGVQTYSNEKQGGTYYNEKHGGTYYTLYKENIHYIRADRAYYTNTIIL